MPRPFTTIYKQTNNDRLIWRIRYWFKLNFNGIFLAAYLFSCGCFFFCMLILYSVTIFFFNFVAIFFFLQKLKVRKTLRQFQGKKAETCVIMPVCPFLTRTNVNSDATENPVTKIHIFQDKIEIKNGFICCKFWTKQIDCLYVIGFYEFSKVI